MSPASKPSAAVAQDDPLADIRAIELPPYVVESIMRECEALLVELEILVIYVETAAQQPPTLDGHLKYQIASAGIRDRIAGIVGRVQQHETFIEQLARYHQH